MVEAASSSCVRKNLNPELRSTRSTVQDARVLPRTARVGRFHILSDDPRKTQNEFVPFAFGPSVNDRLLEANRTSVHRQKKRSGCSVWTSVGDHNIARTWGYSVQRENRMAIVAPDQGWALVCAFLRYGTIGPPQMGSCGFHLGKGDSIPVSADAQYS